MSSLQRCNRVREPDVLSCFGPDTMRRRHDSLYPQSLLHDSASPSPSPVAIAAVAVSIGNYSFHNFKYAPTDVHIHQADSSHSLPVCLVHSIYSGRIVLRRQLEQDVAQLWSDAETT